jgi:hypothetical protein
VGNINVGRKVMFIGGPEAGNVRVVPESHGDVVQGDSDYIYRIYPISLPGNSQKAFFAYAADQHPLQMFVDMWREYSPAAQIRGQMPGVAQTYQKVKPSP